MYKIHINFQNSFTLALVRVDVSVFYKQQQKKNNKRNKKKIGCQLNEIS